MKKFKALSLRKKINDFKESIQYLRTSGLATIPENGILELKKDDFDWDFETLPITLEADNDET